MSDIFSPKQIPLAFRKGGMSSRMGIWFSYRDKDLLVDPVTLAASLEGYKRWHGFFVPEFGESGGGLPDLEYTEHDPVMGDYDWRFNDGWSLLPLTWEQTFYESAVVKSICALYEHAVVFSRETAYGPGNVQYIARSVTRLLAIDYAHSVLKDISFEVESFRTAFVSGKNKISVGFGDCRQVFFDSSKASRNALLHDLEHMVYHDETTLHFPEQKVGYMSGTGYVHLKRIVVPNDGSFPDWLRGRRLMLVSAQGIDPMADDIVSIAAVCDESEVLASLYHGLFLAYLQTEQSRPLEEHIENLKKKRGKNE